MMETSADEDVLVALANTGHTGTDELADAAALAAWWQAQRGPVGATGSTETSLAVLRDLRRVVRAVASQHNGGARPGAGAGVPGTALGMSLDLSGGRVSLTPQQHGDLAGEVATAVVVAALRAGARPGWARVKRCPGPDCGWVFVDASRNASRRWCDMAGCGNRAKTAAFRARRQAG